MISTYIRAVLDGMVEDELLQAAVYQSPQRANVDVSSVQHPFAVYFLPQEGIVDIRGNVTRAVERVQVAFLTRDPLMNVEGNNSDVLLAVVEPMVGEFLSRLREVSTITLPDEVSYRQLYQYDDTNTIGYMLDFRVRENIGFCL